MRYLSIDILRSLAIVLMIIVHFSENLSGKTWDFAGFGAPMFAFLSGVSYRLWLNSRERQEASESSITKSTIRRGLFLFGLGFAFNVLVWFPQDTFNWDVLTFIGVATLTLNVARKLPVPVLVFAAVLVFVMGPLVRQFSNYNDYWSAGSYDYDPKAAEVAMGFIANGYFPIFPWLMYPWIGFLTATVVFPESRDELPRWRGAALSGALLFSLSFVPYLIVTVWPSAPSWIPSTWTMFPASIPYTLRTVGFCLFSFAIGHRWLDRNPSIEVSERVSRVFSTLSRHSLTIYLLHHVLHLWPLWIWTVSQGQEATAYWRQAMPIEYSLPLAFVCLAFCYLFMRWLDQREIAGVEGWMRWLCD